MQRLIADLLSEITFSFFQKCVNISPGSAVNDCELHASSESLSDVATVTKGAWLRERLITDLQERAQATEHKLKGRGHRRVEELPHFRLTCYTNEAHNFHVFPCLLQCKQTTNYTIHITGLQGVKGMCRVFYLCFCVFLLLYAFMGFEKQANKHDSIQM